MALKLETDTPIFTAHCVLYHARCQETQPIYSGGKTKSYQVNPILTLHNFYKTAGKTKIRFFRALLHLPLPMRGGLVFFSCGVLYALASHVQFFLNVYVPSHMPISTPKRDGLKKKKVEERRRESSLERPKRMNDAQGHLDASLHSQYRNCFDKMKGCR